MDNQPINIKVHIDTNELTLTVNGPEQEKLYRDAALLIQQRLRSLRDRHPNLPNKEYYYAVVLLNTAVDAVRSANSASTEPYKETIVDLEKEINNALAK